LKLIHVLEALLFVADEPISAEEFAKSLDVPIGDVDEALDDLMKQCQESRGIQLVKIAGGFQLCTKPELALIIAQFTKPRKNKLTRSQLEVLAVVAYQQPVTMAEIDAVRGVQSDHSLRALLDRREWSLCTEPRITLCTSSRSPILGNCRRLISQSRDLHW
jgi:segregation and condensation protein B